MRHDFAVFQRELQHAVSQRAEQEQAIGVPRAKLEAHRHHAVLHSTWQLQETRGVEGNREGVRFHTGECQITLQSGAENEKIIITVSILKVISQGI